MRKLRQLSNWFQIRVWILVFLTLRQGSELPCIPSTENIQATAQRASGKGGDWRCCWGHMEGGRAAGACGVQRSCRAGWAELSRATPCGVAGGGGACLGGAAGCWGPFSPGVAAHVTHHCFSEKMTFVGFKGSFRPTWVTLVTEDHKAKIFQVVPIPVLRKKPL